MQPVLPVCYRVPDLIWADAFAQPCRAGALLPLVTRARLQAAAPDRDACPESVGIAPLRNCAGSGDSRQRAGWHLRQGAVLLGLLRFLRTDHGWLSCEFEARSGFAPVRPLFEVELELYEQYADWATWEAAYRRVIDLGLSLHPLDGGEPLRDFLLHIDGREAWFKVAGPAAGGSARGRSEEVMR